jgi:hypothetical protein
MRNQDLMQRVRALHAKGATSRQIARSLGVPRAKVASLLRAISADEEARLPQPPLVGCWVSPGWQQGLTLLTHVHPKKGRSEWAGVDGPGSVGAGLVSVLVAREVRPGRIRVGGYLVDVYCLGVKAITGPRLVDEQALPEFVRDFYSAYDGLPVAAPLELAQHLVFGAVEYARGLGFEPAPGFPAAAALLGPWAGPSDIEFGLNGKPFFSQGPYDDPDAIVKTLERSVGWGNFDYLVIAGTLEGVG